MRDLQVAVQTRRSSRLCLVQCLNWGSFGAPIIAIGEAVELLALGTCGPVAEVLQGRLAQALRSCRHVALVGCAYEAANLAWPVWRWQSLGLDNPWLSLAIIAVLGYVVLMHACRVAGMLGLAVVRLARIS